MPIYYQTEYQGATIAVWKVEEPESFFKERTGLHTLIAHAQRRIEYYAGRYLLQLLCPNLELKDIEVLPIGKPFWPGHKVQFSISHSYPYVAVAVHPSQSIGIDVQIFRPKIVRLQSKFLNDSEQALAANDDQMLTLFWSVKEALYKWEATGGQEFKTELLINELHQQHDDFIFSCAVAQKPAAQQIQAFGKLFPDCSLAIATL